MIGKISVQTKILLIVVPLIVIPMLTLAIKDSRLSSQWTT